ncbi:MAG: hypothetical protein PHX21_08525 [bacterium]|nr:hypothetical protein [bacterium]
MKLLIQNGTTKQIQTKEEKLATDNRHACLPARQGFPRINKKQNKKIITKRVYEITDRKEKPERIVTTDNRHACLPVGRDRREKEF